MSHRFVSFDLFQWVGCYALLGGVPFAGLFLVPEEILQSRVAGSDASPVRVVEVGMWFPVTMFVAAVTTLVVGLISACLRRASERTGFAAPTWVRTFVAVLGVSAILAGVVLIYLSVVAGQLTTTVPYILVCISLGMGLSTGSTYYRDE